MNRLVISLLIALSATIVGCGDDGGGTTDSSVTVDSSTDTGGGGDTSPPSDTGTAMDTSTGGDSSAGDTGTGGDSATGDTGTAMDATPTDAGLPDIGLPDAATRGCATDGGTACAGGRMCCSGVPYPMEGICLPDCPAVSDREAKRDFETIDGEEALERIARLPITEWSYRAEPGEVRHIGPMAQDFHREFGLGADDRHIHPVDAAGVTMAALQALLTRVEDLERENQALRDETLELRERVEETR
jgi:hypothetical protein